MHLLRRFFSSRFLAHFGQIFGRIHRSSTHMQRVKMFVRVPWRWAQVRTVGRKFLGSTSRNAGAVETSAHPPSVPIEQTKLQPRILVCYQGGVSGADNYVLCSGYDNLLKCLKNMRYPANECPRSKLRIFWIASDGEWSGDAVNDSMLQAHGPAERKKLDAKIDEALNMGRHYDLEAGKLLQSRAALDSRLAILARSNPDHAMGD